MSLFKSDKAEWSTYIFAPRYYDAYLISGENFWYYEENQREGLGFWANPGGGWRSTGVMTSGGSPSKPVKLPLGVQLTWLSQTERKYYQARITLPREKMLELFHQEYKTDFALKGNTDKINTIVIALSPGGFYAVRLSGARTIEIATGQANPIQVTWRFFAATHHFNPDKLPESEFTNDHYKKLPEDIQKQIDENKFPIERWKNYSIHRFPWFFATKMDLLGCRIACVNGDNRFYDKSDLKNIEKMHQAVPAWIILFFKVENKRYVANIRFTKQRMGAGEKPDDDINIFETFQKFFGTHDASTALVVEKEVNGFEAYLINGSKKEVLTIFHQEIWEAKANQYPWF